MKYLNRPRLAIIAISSLTVFAFLTPARADAVTDWNEHWEEAVFATAQPIPAQVRFSTILHVAIFDAVNGIARKYTPYRIAEDPPNGAREEAAAVQAAYTVLTALYPSQVSVLDAHLAVSLAGIPGIKGNSHSIHRGRAWGEYVAKEILAWRSTDGWATTSPPYFGSLDVGVWRSLPIPGKPDGTLPAAVPQLAFLEPFAMKSPSQFRPGPPYASTLTEALATPDYANDLNEVKAIGRIDSAIRTADQTSLARLWQAMGPVDLNRLARNVAPTGNSLVENARLFALANIATCDALIASMESKFIYELWRPHHAIRFADLDGTPATEAEPEWTALILAPRFPEYISNHSALSGAFFHTLTRLLGDEHTFEIQSPSYPSFSWSHQRFSDAADQVKEARIWAGIHFRTACDVGQEVGRSIADFVLDGILLPSH